MSLLKTTRARALVAISAAAIALAGFISLSAHNSHVLAAKQNHPSSSAMPPIQHPSANPVLVELFTSEGCSDCPPADTLLAHLQQDQPVASANIIALEEHVDYWDHLGWRDRFSSHDVTARQNQYTSRLHLDDNYTPQMIVDGADQFVGSDSAHALKAIASAAHAPKLKLTLSSTSFSAPHATGTISINGQPPAKADLYAALVLKTASTNVERGENGGHTLHHVAAVLALQKIGDTSAPRSFSLNAPQGTDSANLAVVVFAQQPGQGAILGAVSSNLQPTH